MEEDSLQADVMRFMAIVAFCLIAILAMVRNSPGVDTVANTPATTAEAATQSKALPAITPEDDKPIEDQPALVAVVESVKPPVHVLSETETEIEPEPEPEPEPDPGPEPEPEPVPPVPQSDTTKGLTLAFASEADFMRLISKGRITLYAYAGQSFLTTSDTYTFRSTQPPHQFYEIDKQTIPSHVLKAADLKKGGDLQWGVGLSPRIEKQISHYIEANVNGQLHIDRYEQVQHVEAG